MQQVLSDSGKSYLKNLLNSPFSTTIMKISATLLLLDLFTFLPNTGFGIKSSPHSINYTKYMIPEKQSYRTSYRFQPPQNWMSEYLNMDFFIMQIQMDQCTTKEFTTFSSNITLMQQPLGTDIVWGHSMSCDLVNWIHLNNAIELSEPYDSNSCWSGSAGILLNEKPVIMYTGIAENKHQVQNLAMPKTWIKHIQNPVITPLSGAEVDNFRDPSTAWHGRDGEWRVIIGAEKGDEGKAILYQISINGTNGVDTSIQNPSVKHVMKLGYSEDNMITIFLVNISLIKKSLLLILNSQKLVWT